MAQFPEFYQQYLQHLSGRLTEVRRRAEEIAADAAARGLDVKSYIASFTDSPAHSLEGARMAETFAIVEQLTRSYDALYLASTWSRLPVFLSHFDGGLAGDTAQIFVPALPFSSAGLLYAATGAAIGFFLVGGCSAAFHALRQNLATRVKQPSQ